MKKKSWIIVAIIAIILAVVIYFLSRPKKMNKFVFPQTLVVHNNTAYQALDTMSMVIFNRIFLLDTINVNYYNMVINLDTDNIDIVGYVQKNPFRAHSYNIFMKKNQIPATIITFICHELIHIRQMEEGRLVQLNDSVRIFDGTAINLLKTPYLDRPDEMEVFSKQLNVEKTLNKLLYKKP